MEYGLFLSVYRGHDVGYISTSFEERRERSCGKIVKNHMDELGVLTSFIHNHPHGTLGISRSDYDMMCYLLEHTKQPEVKFLIFIAPYTVDANQQGIYWSYGNRTNIENE